MAMIERLAQALEGLRDRAKVEVAFGEPKVVGKRTLIPVAAVGCGFGMGFGKGKGEGEEDGGGGGGMGVKPLAILEVTEERTRVIPVFDTTKVILGAFALAGWLSYLTFKAWVRAREERKKEE